ncbi:MAG TPA: glycosyltransferase [Ramlibacter sp.]|nr:glycosyltransferase [Ramlibacter sp.]
MLRTVELVYFNAGGGHRAAAQALEQVIREQGRPWQVRSVNVMEVLDPQGQFRRFTGMAPEDLYNLRLKKGWTLGLAQELKLFQASLRLAHPLLVERLRPHWAAGEPDLVVSLIPNMNRALYESLASVLPGVPYVTVLTDLADHPPNFWIEPAQRQHFVCGTERAMQQALEQGCESWQLHRTSGMILRPDFYQPQVLDRAAERQALGLDPNRPTGLVLFGGHGSAAMVDIARDLHDVQLVLLCGHNAGLARRLRRLPAGAAPRAVVEFTPHVRRYMQLADFFIGKPGPGSLSEAVQQGLPIVTVRNAWTMPQERYNTEWVREQNLGIVGRSMTRLREPVLQLLDRLDEFKANVRKVDNRAVFEVPAILERILTESLHPAAPPAALSPASRPTP